MAVAVLFSAGKDSALAAHLLDPFYDVVLCHCTFGVESDGSTAETTARQSDETAATAATTATTATAATAAAALELPFESIDLDEAVARDAVDRMVSDGYPREGIQQVHEHALERVADRETVADHAVDAVADGTRRDDRAPTIDRPFAQSLEDRRDVDYLRPLAGYGRSAVDGLVGRYLEVETGPSERLATADYETELRALVAREHGRAVGDDVFPDHVQSRVAGRR